MATVKKNQSGKYYFDRPEIWEEANGERFEREPKFLARIFKKYGNVRKVLDVGCGTGSHLAKLGEFGITGVGIDLNPNMIRFARKRHPNLHFEVRDMRNLGYSSRFEAVICLCTTFAYNTTNEEVVSSLHGFRKALKRGGVLVVDLLNAIGFIQKREFMDKIEAKYEDLGLRSETEHQIDEAAQLLVEKRTFLRLASGRKVKSDTSAFRLFFPQEFRYFLSAAGFEFLDFYGSFNVGDRKLDKARMIFVARK